MIGTNYNVIGKAQSPSKILSFDIDDHGGMPALEGDTGESVNDLGLQKAQANQAKLVPLTRTEFTDPDQLRESLLAGRKNFDSCSFKGPDLMGPFDFSKAFSKDGMKQDISTNGLSFKYAKFLNVSIGFGYQEFSRQRVLDGEHTFSYDRLHSNNIFYNDAFPSGKTFVLRDASFNGASLENVIFLSVDLKSSNFSKLFENNMFARTFFINCNLSDANFYAAKLRGVRLFPDTCISGVDFTKASIQNTNFYTNEQDSPENAERLYNSIKLAKYRGACFNGCDLTGLDFSKADMRGVSFDYSILTDVNFHKTSLIGAQFKRSLINDANFSSADLRCANFLDAVTELQSQMMFPSSSESLTMLRNAGFVDDEFTLVQEFDSIELVDQNTKVFGVIMPEGYSDISEIFGDVDSQDGNFAGMDLSNIDFSARYDGDGPWSHCSVSNANFNNCGFTDSNIYFINIKNSSFKSAKFKNSILYNSSLEASELTNAKFDDVLFSHVGFKDSLLSTATIVSSKFSNSKLENAANLQSISLTPDNLFVDCDIKKLFDALKVTRQAQRMGDEEYRAYFHRLTRGE